MTLSPPLRAAAAASPAPSTLSLSELLPALPPQDAQQAAHSQGDAASAEHLAAASHVRSALRVPRDRALLLRTEEEWRRASAAPSWSHPPSPAHDRALLTSLATLMRLKASDANGDASLLISRTAAAVNPTPIHEMFAPPSPPAVRLLPRPGAGSEVPPASGPSSAPISAGAPLQIMRRAPTSSSSRTSNAAPRPAPPSISEREAAYRAARERIFGAPSADDAETAEAGSSSGGSGLRKEGRAGSRASPQPAAPSPGELSHEASAWTGYPLPSAGDARASGDTDAFSPFAPSAPTSRSASVGSSGPGPSSGATSEAYPDARTQQFDPSLGMDTRHSYGAAQPGYGPAGAYWAPPNAAGPHAAAQNGAQNGSQWVPERQAPWGAPPAHTQPGAWNGGAAGYAAGPSRPPQASMGNAYGDAQRAAPPSRLDLPGALGRRQQAGSGRLYDPNSSSNDSQSRANLSGRLSNATSSANTSGNASPAMRPAHVSGPVMRTLPPTFVMPSPPANGASSSGSNTSPGTGSPSGSQGRRSKVLPHPSLPARPDWVTLTPPPAAAAPSISTPGSSSSGGSSTGPTSRDGALAASGPKSGRSTPSGANGLPRPPHIAHAPHSSSSTSSSSAAVAAAHLPPNPTLTWDAPVNPAPAPHVRRPTTERSSPASLPRLPTSAALPPTPQPAVSSNGPVPPSRSSADFPPLGGTS